MLPAKFVTSAVLPLLWRCVCVLVMSRGRRVISRWHRFCSSINSHNHRVPTQTLSLPPPTVRSSSHASKRATMASACTAWPPALPSLSPLPLFSTISCVLCFLASSHASHLFLRSLSDRALLESCDALQRAITSGHVPSPSCPPCPSLTAFILTAFSAATPTPCASTSQCCLQPPRIQWQTRWLWYSSC